LLREEAGKLVLENGVFGLRKSEFIGRRRRTAAGTASGKIG